MKNKNEMCQFSILSEKIIVPANVIGKMVNCSESAVKKVRTGIIGGTGRGKVCKQIVVTELLLKEAFKISIEQVSSVINKTK